MKKKTIQEVSCGIIPIFQKENGELELLLVEAHHGGIGFPKGHMEKNETYLDTALRESYEEVGLVPEYILEEPRFTEHYIVHRPQKKIEKTVHYFIGSLVHKGFTKQDSEIKNAFWCSFSQAELLINHASTKKLFKKVQDFLLKMSS